MNPLTITRNITKLNEREIKLGIKETASWHKEYKDSAWIFIGGLDFQLTEGDVISVFSQYGEIVNINLVRDMKTGKSKGFCFLCYEDQRSTDLAVDNFNGIKLCGRTIRVDHVANYKMPKIDGKTDIETRKLREDGCAPKSYKEETKDTSNNTPVKVKKEIQDKTYDKYDIAKTSRHYKKEDLSKRIEANDAKQQDERSHRNRHKNLEPESKSNRDKDASNRSTHNRTRVHDNSSSSTDSEEARMGSRKYKHKDRVLKPKDELNYKSINKESSRHEKQQRHRHYSETSSESDREFRRRKKHRQ